MKKINFIKGFTLIELLVVIAILGILSSIVIGRVTDARAKGANVAIKANLANIRTQAALLHESSSSYNSVCTDTIVGQGLIQAGTLGGDPAKCFDAMNTWVVAGKLNAAEGTISHWCADSASKSAGITEAQYNAITGAATLCP